jgi:hypothetical protein
VPIPFDLLSAVVFDSQIPCRYGMCESAFNTAEERHGMCESAFNTAGERHGMCESAYNTAGERHGMCESALREGQK